LAGLPILISIRPSALSLAAGLLGSGSAKWRRSRGRRVGKPVDSDIVLAMRIHILALNGVFDTGLAAVLDAFSTANGWRK